MHLNCYKESDMKRIFCFAVAILFLAAVMASPGGEFWEKKDYKQWNQKECEKLLKDSPWARPHILSSVGIMDNASNKTSSDGQQPIVTYQVQFFSAKPIRMATVRQAQLVQKYESLSPEQKQAMDKQTEAFLSQDFSDSIVVNVAYSTNDNVRDQELARYWQSQTTDVLKNNVYLSNTKGDKIYVGRYVVGQGAGRSFQFIFPRASGGNPLISPQDKAIKVNFSYPVIGGMGDGKAFMEFKLDKMIFDGNFAF